MVKAELIEKMAANSHLTQAQAKQALNVFLQITTSALAKGDKVKIVTFGTFSISKRKERNGVHPKTGLPITIHAKKVVKFTPAVELIRKREKNRKSFS